MCIRDRSVVPGQLERSFVHVNRPNLRGRRAARYGDGNWAVAAPKVQQVTAGRGEGGLFEQRERPEVDRPRGEDPPIGLKLNLEVARSQAQGTRLRCGFGHRVEVVTALRAG